jgi:hypothetical protein
MTAWGAPAGLGPVIEYTEDGTLQPAEGIETVSAFEYLP